MRVPLSWLRDFVTLPAGLTGRQIADAIVAAGLEVETVDVLGADLTGPLVIGRVVEITELTGFKKPIRYCRVDVGGHDPGGESTRGVVCGARNFAVGDVVVAALPGAVLPGGFAIAARTTYDHVSDGMICSEVELGMGAEADGIIVLPADTPVGADALEVLGLRDEVLDIAVTPDRGYALSVRGVAREVATAFDLPFRDPGLAGPPTSPALGYPVRLEDETGCDRFVARAVTDLDPTRVSPPWLRRRLQMAGMRPLSLAVDITNYVMLELGQPLHGYDRAELRGEIAVRRARSGEKLETLDGVTRDLDPTDLLITDDSGPIGLAGVMGGASTEITAGTTDVLIEAAHFDPVTIARGARRHRLPSEASRRFERGVDPTIQAVAAQRAVDLLVALGGAVADGALTDVGHGPPPTVINIDAAYPGRVAGHPINVEKVLTRLRQVGAVVTEHGDTLDVVAPPWRPDLTDPADLAEEVIRLEGYGSVPSVLPAAPAGRGLTRTQKQRRGAARALASAGYVEVLNYPFVGAKDLDGLGLPADDPRRVTLRLANPIADTEPELRTTLLPGLLTALRRNVGRGLADVALFELGTVFLPTPGAPAAPRPPVDRRATPEELAATAAALPAQPRHLGAVLAGGREPAGWWGAGREATWADAVQAARTVAAAVGADLTVRAGAVMPWHPGRCAELVVRTDDGEQVVGHAGELHPRVVGALGLPARTAAMELDLDALGAAGHDVTAAPRISVYPAATQDVALVVDAAVPAADVEAALREGAGDLLEAIRLFDVYAGEQVDAGKRSLAFALRFRAPDRTLTVEEATAARDAAVATATARFGAVLRG
jgi:phenylalanyl-tRNA synthetase beta chain